MQVPVIRNILEKNEKKSEEIKSLMKTKKILTLNLMSSPGAGKTTLLETTLQALKPEFKMAVIEGDIQTSNDAQRIASTGAQTVQINTEGACHLESSLIMEAINRLDLNELDILFIENVGNLVCPAEFNVGEDCKVALLSIPEGDDKPEKYPLMFAESSLMILNKIDLLPYLDFDLGKAKKAARGANPKIDIITTSAKTGEGMDKWYQWLRTKVRSKKES